VALIGDEAARAASAGQWDAALRLGREAATSDPSLSVYQVTLGLAASALGDHQAASAAFRTAVEQDDLPVSWLDLAAEQVALGDTNGARSSLAHAMRLGWQQAPFAFGAATLYLELDDAAAADDALVTSLLTAPSLAGDPGWRAVADGALGYETAIDHALSRTAGVVRWEIATLSGNETVAEETLATIEPASREVLALAGRAFAGEREASRELVRRVDAKPFDPALLQWAARAALATGDIANATRIRRLALLSTLETGYAVAVVADGHIEASAGDRTTYYGLFTYRREAPLDKIVASLPALAYR
jgi:tetratricopeptide (TPR) repeat protein